MFTTTLLLLTACLATDRDRCEEQRLPKPEMSLMTCQMLSLQMVAEWSVTHPHHRVAGWRCVDGRNLGMRA